MLRYLIRRFLQSLLVVFAVSVLVFLLIHLSGDPARMLAPLDASDEDIQNIREQYGLDKPFHEQYLFFVRKALRGDLGESYKYRRDALSFVLHRFPATITLAVTSFMLAVLVSFPLGILAATRGRLIDYISTFFSLTAISIPSFWLGIMLIVIFAGKFKWLPASGRGSWRHLILPTIALSAYYMGLITRLVRATMLEILKEDYITVARAKGLQERRVLIRHAFKNTLIPVITVLGLNFGSLLAGSVVVETVFAWPGVGWLLVQGINSRDLPLIRAAVLIIGIFFIGINFLVDVLYGYLDPRIGYG